MSLGLEIESFGVSGSGFDVESLAVSELSHYSKGSACAGSESHKP